MTTRAAHYTEAMSSKRRITSSLSKSSGPYVPDPQPLSQALAQHQGLARLGRLLQESNRRMAIVEVALPGAMRRFVRAGPVDEAGWTLLAANAAVATKLRHLHPRLLELLAEAGIPPGELRIRVLQSAGG